MNKIAARSPMKITMTPRNKLVRMIRGASMVEYALLLVAVLVLAAAAFKTIGPKVKEGATKTASQL